LLLFATLGFGLALPFLLLGYVPALRKLLPRPGKWMDTFRKILAIPMGLVAVALLWLCWRLGGEEMVAGAIGLAVAFLMLLAGRRHRLGSHKAWGPVYILLALGGFQLVRHADRPEVGAEQSLLAAVPFSETALAEARAANKPVFLWFTADWCLTCKVNEGVAIEREATREAFAKAGVVAMRGDWTRRDPAITRFLTAHGAAGVPLYVWYAPGKDGEVLPQVLTPDMLGERAAGS
jgi:thiol:disulfide interchange protein